jgi:anti-anti-sigma regulatory factor/nucleotide-binding universal stress UspA family protein
MIIDARDDVVTLSGCLDHNVWPAIQAPANLLLRQHPAGILIDASQLEMCSTEGVKTFVDAIAYIERYRARIVLCNVPDIVNDVIRSVPGARSSVATAPDRESGRASLALAQTQRVKNRSRWAVDTADRPILVPLIPAMSTTREAIGIARILAASLGNINDGADSKIDKSSAVIHLAFFLEVPRSMPLSAPFLEEEDHARRLLNEAESIAAKTGAKVRTHIIRARNTAEEIIEQASLLNINTIVLSLPAVAAVDQSVVQNLFRQVLQNAKCEVMLKRIAEPVEKS